MVDNLIFSSAIVGAVSDNHGSSFGLRALFSVAGTAWGPCGGALVGLRGDGRYRVVSSFGIDDKALTSLQNSDPRIWFPSGNAGVDNPSNGVAVNLPGEGARPEFGVACWWSDILVGTLYVMLHAKAQPPVISPTATNALALATFHLLLEEDDLVVSAS